MSYLGIDPGTAGSRVFLAVETGKVIGLIE